MLSHARSSPAETLPVHEEVARPPAGETPQILTTPLPPPARRARVSPDLIIAVVLFGLGLVVGTTDVAAWSDRNMFERWFYQYSFGPAVMNTCGKGFVYPADYTAPQLHAFLYTKIDAMTCAGLPPRLVTVAPTAFQATHRYLLEIVSMVWSITGLSWSALNPLFGIFYGLTAAILYGLFRLGMKRPLAVVGAVLLMFSAANLGMLPFLRDYSKAPPILAGLLIMGYLVSRPVTRPLLLALSALAGLVLGVGIGMRVDVLIVVPAFLLTVVFFFPGKWSATWRDRILAGGLFLMAFGIVGGPILAAFPSRGDSFDNILFGFMSPFDGALGVHTPVYEWGYLYLTMQLLAIMGSYAYAADGTTVSILSDPHLHDQVGSHYFFTIASNFPADMLTRLYGAILRVLELPFYGTANHLFLDPFKQALPFDNAGLLSLYRGLEQVLIGAASSLGIIACALTLVILSRHIRLALFVGFVLIYFCGYGMLQFSLRHYFHLEFIALWAVGFVAQQAIMLVRRGIKTRASAEGGRRTWRLERWWTPDTRRMAVFSLGGLLVLTIPLAVLRAYQQSHVETLLKAYTAAPLQRLPVTYATDDSDPDKILVVPQGLQTAAHGTGTGAQPAMQVDYLVVDLKEQAGAIPLTFHYKNAQALTRLAMDQSRTISLTPSEIVQPDGPAGTTRLYFPVFTGPGLTFGGLDVQFSGLEIPRADLAALQGLYRIKDSRQFPLVLWLTLRPGWEQTALYDTLTGWEDGNIQASPPAAPAGAILAKPVTTPLRSRDVQRHLPVVDVSANQLRVQGVIGLQNVIQYKPQAQPAGSYLIAKGFLYWGCFDLSLKQGDLLVPATVRQPGSFSVVLRVPQDGQYVVAVDDSACPGQNNYSISEIGWQTNVPSLDRRPGAPNNRPAAGMPPSGVPTESGKGAIRR